MVVLLFGRVGVLFVVFLFVVLLGAVLMVLLYCW